MDYQSIVSLSAPADCSESFVFSFHKAGSTLLFAMLENLCRVGALSGVSIPDVLFQKGIFETDWGVDDDLLPLFRRGFLYFGFRVFPPILASYSRLREVPLTLLVRDPRDALVSQYFSFGGKHMSHVLPEANAEQWIEKYAESANLNIDQFVIAVAPDLLRKLEEYHRELPLGKVFIMRYEELFNDKQSGLQALLAHHGIAIDSEVVSRIAARHDVRPEKEDPTQHIRKGTPGDHREKLQPETIIWLTEYFRGPMELFGYNL